MPTQQIQNRLSPFLQQSSHLAVAFFGLSSVLLGLAFTSAWLLIETLSFQPVPNRIIFPGAFLVSTGLLATGSLALHRASVFVRFERQTAFRRNLTGALLSGTGFTGVQVYGLWCLVAQQQSAESVGLKDGAFAFALLHGVHFLVALLFVSFVFLRAFADRYDHEYSWGVTFCAWFWHALGIAWMAIMAAFLIAGFSVLPGDSYRSL